jgi:hypothetical protein
MNTPSTLTELQLSAELARARHEIERLRGHVRTPKEAVFYHCRKAQLAGQSLPKLAVLMKLTGCSMGSVVRWRNEWIKFRLGK